MLHLVRAYTLPVIAVLIAGISQSCRDTQRNQPKVERSQVFVATLREEDVTDEFIYPSKVLAEHEIELVSEVGGLIRLLKVKFGDHVKPGQLLAGITNPDPLAGFKIFRLTAPFEGDVAQTFVQTGDRVQVGQKILRLIDTRSMKALVNVNASDLSYLSVGMRAQWMALDGSGQLPVKVRSIGRVIDSTLGTALCELHFEGRPPQGLISGSLGRIRFTLNKRRAIIVQQKSIFYKEKKPHLIVVGEDGKAKYQAVEIAHAHDDKVELGGGLKPGLRIVAQSIGYVSDGEELNIMSDGKS